MKLNIKLSSKGRKQNNSFIPQDTLTNESSTREGLSLPQVLDSVGAASLPMQPNEYSDNQMRRKGSNTQNFGGSASSNTPNIEKKRSLVQDIRQRQINISNLSKESNRMQKEQSRSGLGETKKQSPSERQTARSLSRNSLKPNQSKSMNSLH